MTRRSLVVGAAASGSMLAIALSLRSLRRALELLQSSRASRLLRVDLRARLTLDERFGSALSAATLAGAYVVVALIFTRCPSVCPTLVRSCALQRSACPRPCVAKRLRVFSIDPEHDSVARFTPIANSTGSDVDHFTLARAEADAVRELGATLGFGFSTEPGSLPTTRSW